MIQGGKSHHYSGISTNEVSRQQEGIKNGVKALPTDAAQ